MAVIAGTANGWPTGLPKDSGKKESGMDSRRKARISRRSLVAGAGAASALALTSSSTHLGAQATPYAGGARHRHLWVLGFGPGGGDQVPDRSLQGPPPGYHRRTADCAVGRLLDEAANGRRRW